MDWKQLRAEIAEQWRRARTGGPGRRDDRSPPRNAELEPRYATAQAGSRGRGGESRKPLR